MADEKDNQADLNIDGGKKKKIIIILIAVIVLLGGGGGAYYFLMGDDSTATQRKLTPAEQKTRMVLVLMEPRQMELLK